MIGFIKLPRNIKGTWIHKDPVYFKAYCDILLNVNWETKPVLIGHETMICGPGEALYSLESWSKIFGGDWNKGKVRRFFSRLERGNAIRTQSERKTTRLKVVNIEHSEQEANAKGTQKERKPTPTKEERIKKKDIKSRENKEKTPSLEKELEKLRKENNILKAEKEKERKKVAVKKERHSFPKNEPQKKYDTRDKRPNKQLPFDLRATKETLDCVYPSWEKIAQRHKENTGRDIKKDFVKQELQSFIEVGIPNHYPHLRDISLVLSKFDAWLIKGEKYEQQNKSKSKTNGKERNNTNNGQDLSVKGYRERELERLRQEKNCESDGSGTRDEYQEF